MSERIDGEFHYAEIDGVGPQVRMWQTYRKSDGAPVPATRVSVDFYSADAIRRSYVEIEDAKARHFIALGKAEASPPVEGAGQDEDYGPTASPTAGGTAESETGWLPIDSAPKDGTWLILGAPFVVGQGRYEDGNWRLVGGGVWEPTPTHFQPLPESPHKPNQSSPQLTDREA